MRYTKPNIRIKEADMDPDGCNCDLCLNEETWEREHGTCYRCSHDLPCSYADENDESCITVLDRITQAIK